MQTEILHIQRLKCAQLTVKIVCVKLHQRDGRTDGVWHYMLIATYQMQTGRAVATKHVATSKPVRAPHITT